VKTHLMLLAMIALPAGLTQAQDNKAGAWELKSIRKLDQGELATEKQREEARKHMTPAERARADAERKVPGEVTTSPDGTQTHTRRFCLSKEEASAEVAPADLPKSCELKVSRNGNTATGTWNCADKKFSGVQVMTLESDEKFSMRTTMQFENSSKPLEFTLIASYIGPDCTGLPSRRASTK
jgi:hypothetical protein